MSASGLHIGNHMSRVSRFRPIMTGNGLTSGMHITKAGASTAYRYGMLSGKFAEGLGKGLRFGGGALGWGTALYSGYKFINEPTLDNGLNTGLGVAGLLSTGGLVFSGVVTIAVVTMNSPAYQADVAAFQQANPGIPHMNWVNNGILCFTAGTKILMGDGSQRDIENVQVSDTVKTYNFKAKEIENNVVLRVDAPMHDNLVTIEFKKGIMNTNTTDHPYFVKGKGWCSFNPGLTNVRYGIETSKLHIGDVCYIYSEGKLKRIKVIDISKISGSLKTYNLTQISNSNNYFVVLAP